MRRTTVAPILALVLLATLSACEGTDPGGEPAAEELVLRGYPAPGSAEELTEALRRLLSIGDRRVGEVREGPGEQILLLAPRSVHEGFESVIRTATERAPASAGPSSVTMTYWFVAARPASGDAAGPAASLGEVRPALEEIESVQGPQDFRLIDRMQLRQFPDGGSSRAQSAKFDLTQSVAVSGDDVVAMLRAVADPVGHYRMATTLKLHHGQLLVLGQVGLDPKLDPFADPETLGSGAASLVHLIIRADVEPPA